MSQDAQQVVVVSSAATSRSFECETPATERSILRLQEALPFPEKFEDVLSWTNEFVERIAQQTKKEQKNHKTLENEIADVRAQLQESQKQLTMRTEEKLAVQNETVDLKAKLQEAQQQLTIRTEENTRVQKETVDLKAKLQDVQQQLTVRTEEKTAIQKETVDLQAKLQEAQRQVTSRAEEKTALDKVATDLKGQLQESQKQLASKINENNLLQASVVSIQASVDQFKKDNTKLQSDISKLSSSVKRPILSAAWFKSTSYAFYIDKNTQVIRYSTFTYGKPAIGSDLVVDGQVVKTNGNNLSAAISNNSELGLFYTDEGGKILYASITAPGQTWVKGTPLSGNVKVKDSTFVAVDGGSSIKYVVYYLNESTPANILEVTWLNNADTTWTSSTASLL